MAALISVPCSETAETVEDRAEAVVAVEAGGAQLGAVLREDLGQEGAHDVPEDDRVGDLHHRRLEVHREEHALGCGAGDLRGEEGVEGRSPQDGGVDDLTGEDGEPVLERHGRAVGADEPDGQGVVGGEHDGLLVGAEVVLAHRRDVGLRLRRPGTHGVGVLAGVGLDRRGGAAVGVAFAQDGVDRRALDLVVAGADVALLVGRRLVGVVGQRDPLLLELRDRGLELRHRGRDVGQLDDVGVRRRGQVAELGEGVALALGLGEEVGERRDDAPGEGDVPGLDVDPGGRGIRLDDREEGVGRQQRAPRR